MRRTSCASAVEPGPDARGVIGHEPQAERLTCSDRCARRRAARGVLVELSAAQRRQCIVSVMANDAFRALAHPLRRGIVERLAHGPATVGEATGRFGVSKPTITRHVKVLEDSGVVARTIDGRTHRLRLDLDALGEAVDWIDRQRAIWERMLDAVEVVLEERKEAR
jgi:DNA-binding transcriptional ArsR family regulator